MADSLRARLRADLLTALKARDQVRSSTLRLAADALQNEEIALKKISLTDEEVLRVLEREAKRRREAADAYERGGRPELAEAERRELAVITVYLPTPLTDMELEQVVREVVTALGASAPTAVGAVMKEVMTKVRGRVDGARVKALVSRILSISSP
ncbi:MAG: hypothetical protein G01um101438_903 [Parcubacteria group bacterium Gr01-1014_38]|nr:MAG: hypothetical protein G01um101438_903 [Parcubacteria group bacterium Gr01-1014_38]